MSSLDPVILSELDSLEKALQTSGGGGPSCPIGGITHFLSAEKKITIGDEVYLRAGVTASWDDYPDYPQDFVFSGFKPLMGYYPFGTDRGITTGFGPAIVDPNNNNPLLFIGATGNTYQYRGSYASGEPSNLALSKIGIDKTVAMDAGQVGGVSFFCFGDELGDIYCLNGNSNAYKATYPSGVSNVNIGSSRLEYWDGKVFFLPYTIDGTKCYGKYIWWTEDGVSWEQIETGIISTTEEHWQLVISKKGTALLSSINATFSSTASDNGFYLLKNFSVTNSNFTTKTQLPFPGVINRPSFYTSSIATDGITFALRTQYSSTVYQIVSNDDGDTWRQLQGFSFPSGNVVRGFPGVFIDQVNSRGATNLLYSSDGYKTSSTFFPSNWNTNNPNYHIQSLIYDDINRSFLTYDPYIKGVNFTRSYSSPTSTSFGHYYETIPIPGWLVGTTEYEPYKYVRVK